MMSIAKHAAKGCQALFLMIGIGGVVVWALYMFLSTFGPSTKPASGLAARQQVASAVSPPAQPIEGKRLAETIRGLTTPWGPMFTGYEIDHNSATVTLNSRIWDQLPKDQRLTLMEQFARCDFLRKDGLLNAWVKVDGVTVGRVRADGWVPDDGYWKHR